MGSVFAVLSRYALVFWNQGLHQGASLSLDKEEALFCSPHRHDQTTAGGELILERLRKANGRGGDSQPKEEKCRRGELQDQ